MRNKLVIIGAGSLGVMTLDIALELDTYDQIQFIDDGRSAGELVHGVEVIGGVDRLLELNIDEYDFIIAIANNKIRNKIAVGNQRLNFVNLIHPRASVSRLSKLGKGNIILPNVTVDPETIIDDHVVINKNSSLGHNVHMMSYSQASPGCNLGGEIGEVTFLGLNTTVLPEMKIGSNSIVGAGAVVTKDLPSGCTAVGVPAKVIKYHKE